MTPIRDEDDDEPTLTEDLRGFLRPRTGWLLLVLGLVALALVILGLVASHTVLAPLWH